MTRLGHASLGKSLDPMTKPCQTLTQNPFWTQCLYPNLVKRTRAKLARDSLMLPRLRHLSPNTVLPAAWTTTTLSRTSASRPPRLCHTTALLLLSPLSCYYLGHHNGCSCTTGASIGSVPYGGRQVHTLRQRGKRFV